MDPKTSTREPMKHPNDMTRDELREVVSAMSWLALDLAQHIHFTIYMLKPEYVPQALERACGMAYDLSSYPYSEERLCPDPKVQIAFFGAGGLTVERFGEFKDAFPLDCPDLGEDEGHWAEEDGDWRD